MLEIIKQALTLYVVVPLILGAGIYLSFKLKFIQFRKFGSAVKYTLSPATSSHKTQIKFSSLGALTAVLGGNLGTGNIAGIAVALSLGGPGSLFWMVIMVLSGTIIKFCGCFLGVKYRQKDDYGNWVGGPMYYLSKGLKCRYLDRLFCWVLLGAAVTTGNFIQVHSIASPFNQAKLNPLLIASLIAILVGIVMLGGLKIFSKVVIALVPFMAIFYISASLFILVKFKSLLLPSIKLILNHACSPRALSGVGASCFIGQAIRVGFDRGIMATDTGIGIAPIVHAKVTQAKSSDYTAVAFQQGLISTLAPIIVLLICILTGLVLIVTDSWRLPIESTKMCITAFELGLNNFNVAMIVVNATLFLFAFTTILTWGYCADNAVQYLFPHNHNFYRILFKLLFIALIPCGILFEVKMLWNLADLCLNLMLLINMYGLLRLKHKILEDIKLMPKSI